MSNLRLPLLAVAVLALTLLPARQTAAQESRTTRTTRTTRPAAPRLRPPALPSVMRIGIAGGLSLPGGDLGRNADAGWAIALRGETPLRAARWDVRADVALDRFAGRGAVDSYSYASLAGNLVHREAGGRLYEFGGLGVYNAHTSFVNDFDRGDTNLGVQFGVGVEMPSRASRWFAEAGLTSAFTSGRSSLWFPVRVGMWF